MGLPSIVEEGYKALMALLETAGRHLQSVLNALLIAVCIAVSWHLWTSYDQRHFVLFVGPAGSSTAVVGPKLVDAMIRETDGNGSHFAVSLESTPSSISIRERMLFESTRIPMGIIEDGPQSRGESAHQLRALLPIEWDYLFVVCSREFLTRINVRPVADRPITLGEVIKRVGSGKLYLGPENTNSFALASLALAKYDQPKLEHYATAITDWDQMRTAFKGGLLELAFYSGPMGNSLIEKLASDGTVVMISLGDVTDAIQFEQGQSAYAAKFPENLGVQKSSDEEPATWWQSLQWPLQKKGDVIPFCGQGLRTLATRRVLAVPRTVSTSDAFLLAKIAQRTLQEDHYHINLKADDLPHGSSSDVKCELRMVPHEALELLRQNKAPVMLRDPLTWPWWAQAIGGAFAGLIAIDVLRLIARKVSPSDSDGGAGSDADDGVDSVPKPKVPLTNSDQVDYKSLDTILSNHETQIDELTHQEIAADLATWDVRLRDLRRIIHRSKKLSESQRESLWQRYRRLTFEVETSPRWGATNGRRKAEKVVSPSPASTQPAKSGE